MSNFKGVILDIDGTLIDSNDAHARSWVDTFAEAGKKVPFEVVRPLIGKGGDKLVPEVSGIPAGSDEFKRLTKRRTAIFKEKYLSNLHAFPQTRDLITAFEKRGLKLQIATSATEDEVKDLLEVAGTPEIMEQKTTSDDAENSKPDPDIVHAALAKIKLAPLEVVMLGDTPYDVEAAKRAGVSSFVFRCGGWWKDADFEDALAIFDGPAELLTKLDDYF